MERRTFLRRSAAFGAAASGLALAGCVATDPDNFRASANTEIEATDNALIVEVSGKIWHAEGGSLPDKMEIHVQLFEGEALLKEKRRMLNSNDYGESEDGVQYGTSFEVPSDTDVGAIRANTDIVTVWLDGEKYTPSPDDAE